MIRTIVFVLFALGLLELFLLVKTGQWFGAWFPILAVILGIAAGGVTIRHTGIRSLNEIRTASQGGQVGPDTAIGGMLGFLAGILFILPGLLSDILAILLLMPFTRAFITRRITWLRPRPRQGGVVIDGEAVEIHTDRLPPDRDQENNEDSPWRR